MRNRRNRVVGISGLILSFVLLGCGGEVESPPAEGTQIEINPAMEKMKSDMMAKYGKKTAPRKAVKGKN
jgi:hypothetical protein